MYMIAQKLFCAHFFSTFYFRILLPTDISYLVLQEYFELQSSETEYTSSGNLGHSLVNRKLLQFVDLYYACLNMS
jgi:hypothetical protein